MISHIPEDVQQRSVVHMDPFLDPLVMTALFVLFLSAIVAYALGHLQGVREASKPWTEATGIELEELDAGTYKTQLARLREEVARARTARRNARR